MEGSARDQRLFGSYAIEVTLDLAEVLRAGDDLLTRIAALVETDAAELLEVGHLGYELLTRGGADQRKSGHDIEPAPRRDAGR